MQSNTTTKSVLITGCSSGFGLGLTKALLAENWHVIATARNLETSAELRAIQHPLLTLKKLDVTKQEDLQNIQEYINKELNGQLDCLINNAGYGLLGPLEELAEEQIRNQMETNFFGVVLLTKICLPALRKTRGRIFNVSSIVGYFGIPFYSLYVASKFSLEGLSESLYHELAPHGVQVTLIEPGAFNTRFGDNVAAPQPGNEVSVYTQQRINFERMKPKMNIKKSNASDQLAKTVIKLLRKKTMPLRTRLGTDAQMVYFLKRILPAPVYYFIISTIFKRAFLTPIEKS